MGIFSKLFSKNTEDNKRKNIAMSLECEKLLELGQFMNDLVAENSYIAKSEYRQKLEDSRDIIEFFSVLKKSNTLKVYCDNNGIESKLVLNIIANYYTYEEVVDRHNKNYIKEALSSERTYLDNVLKECDSNIVLDDNQRRVVLTDEDYCLVVAGAGAGKTTTVAAKVKYLVDKKGIDPKQILVISFTNKAVNELKERIIGQLHIECPITTFHATGNAILKKHNPEKLNIVEEGKLYYVVQDYFRNEILKSEKNVNNLILFFSSYFDVPYESEDVNKLFELIAKSNYTTLRSEFVDFEDKVIDIRSKKAISIQSELLRSSQEVEIANFLYLNGIDYKYEPIYQYNIPFARKPYTPDFVIEQDGRVTYIEHFGVSEDGKNNRFTPVELERYKNAINDKVKLHREHKTDLIYTFSKYNDRRSITEHLKEKLEAHGYELRPRSSEEVFQKLVESEENRYIRKLVNLVCRFISNYKTNGYDKDEFKSLSEKTDNVRTRLFLSICHDCYLYYEKYLKENNAVDFQDMINESARLLREVKEMKQKLNFKYIIVDEYQDISRQRFDLVRALSDVTDAKIIAVGDDWQSIYAFSGSDITLFTQFKEKMGYAECMNIVNTYRNSQDVIDIAGNFIQKSDAQLKKSLISPKRIDDPVIIYTYDGTRKKSANQRTGGADYALAMAINEALGDIVKRTPDRKKTVLLLGRYGFDGDRLERTGEFIFTTKGGKIKSEKYPWLDITFMTAHASKGLGFDNVVVINGRNETYGFPSKIEDDPVLSLVIKQDNAIEYAEERRLFYVAMTRTKNRVYCIAPENNPSEFLLELKRDYKNVVLKGEWNEDITRIASFRKNCPMCGYPMQFRYKNAYGLRLHICTNEPEICGFMTNDYGAGKLSIMKCDSCQDGYLIVKRGKLEAGKDEYFLGCTNYKKDGTGCNNMLTRTQYYNIADIADSIPAPKVNIKRGLDSSTNINKSINEKPIVKEEPRYVDIEKAEVKVSSYKGLDLNDVIHTVLQCLQHVSEIRFYGETMLISVLKGGRGTNLKKAGLENIAEYGALKALSSDEIGIVVDWALKYGYILKTKGLYPVLHPTSEGAIYKTTLNAKRLKVLENTLISLAEYRGTDYWDIFEQQNYEYIYKDASLDVVVAKVVDCVDVVNYLKGQRIDTVIDVLLGRKRNEEAFFKFEATNSFGCIKGYTKAELHNIIDWLKKYNILVSPSDKATLIMVNEKAKDNIKKLSESEYKELLNILEQYNKK